MMDELQKQLAEAMARNYYRGEVPAEHWKKKFFEMCDQRDEWKARAETAEAALAATPLPEIEYLAEHAKYGAENQRCMNAVRVWLRSRK